MSGLRPVGSKSTTPTAAQRERGSRNGGAISHQRKQAEQTPAERWAEAVDGGHIERFKAMMAERYADEDADSCPLASTQGDFHKPDDHRSPPSY